MSSPSPLPGPDPASTPAGGVPAAPRGRRRDHLLTGALGLILAPACLILAGLAAQMRLPTAAGLVYTGLESTEDGLRAELSGSDVRLSELG